VLPVSDIVVIAYESAAQAAQGNLNFDDMSTIEKSDDFLNYKPGSSGAIQRGCTCPEAENNFGRGRSKNGVIEAIFTADPWCPIHGFEVLFGKVD
jgi:hypothetical protein